MTSCHLTHGQIVIVLIHVTRKMTTLANQNVRKGPVDVKDWDLGARRALQHNMFHHRLTSSSRHFLHLDLIKLERESLILFEPDMSISTSNTRHHVAPQPTLLPKPSTHTTQNDTIESHLKHICLSMIHALNIRDVDPSSPAWAPATSDFLSQSSFRSNQLSCNLTTWLELFDEQTRDHPEHFLMVRDIDVHVNSKRNRATVFIDFETSGELVGIRKPSVAVAEFLLVGSEGWKCRKWRCLPGMEVLGVEGL